MLSLVACALATPTWDWGVDGPITVGAGGVYLALYYGVEPQMRPYGLVSEPEGLDALVAPRYDAGIATVSDAVLYGSMAGSVAAAALLDRGAGARVGIVVESFAVNGLLTETLKLGVRRPRPYTAEAGLVDDATDIDREMSFPSGHTSTVATTTFAAARLWQMEGATPAQAALGYGAATALTLGVGSLRVAAGKHHVSDVLAGALLGGAVGVMVPSLHPAPVDLSVTPGGVGVSGTF